MADDWMHGTVESLIGGATVESSRSWVITGLSDASSLERDLRVLQLEDAEIAKALHERNLIFEEVASIDGRIERIYESASYHETPQEVHDLLQRKESLLQRFKNLVARRRFRVDDVTQSEVRLPLFVLAAPSPEGCSATFSTAAMMGRALTWNVKLLGSGLGGSSDIRVTSTWRFEAAAGDRKLVFLPVTVITAAVTILEGTRVVATTHQVAASEVSTARAPGLLLLAPGAQPPAGDLIRSFSLAGDTSGAIAKFEESYETTAMRRIELGVGAFGVETQLSAEISIAKEIVLSLELRGGFDYELRGLAVGEGMAWSYTDATSV